MSDHLLEIINSIQIDRFNNEFNDDYGSYFPQNSRFNYEPNLNDYKNNQYPMLLSTNGGYGQYPSRTWGFNYQPNPQDYKSIAYPTFLSMFQNYVSLYNMFVDHSAQRINELQAYVSSVDRKNSLMNTALLSHDGTITELSRRINSINSTLGSHDGTITELSRRINSINSTLGSHDGTITELSRRINTINSTLSSHAGSITVLTRRNTQLGEVVGNVQRIVTSHDGSINTLSSRHNSLGDVVTNVQRIVTSHDGSINSLSSDLKTQTGRIDNVAKNVESVSNSVVSNANRINLLVASDVLINNKLNSAEKDIDRLNKTVIAEALVTANLVSRVGKVEDYLSNMEKLSDYFAVELTSVEGENSNEAEGSFVKLFKGQITRLNKFNDDLNFKLRYSLIAEFSELKEALDVHFLETQNKIAEYGLLLNKNLETINAWLKIIYEKPFNVEIPPITVLPSNPFVFDYDKLQEMFDNLNFGDMVNEAGTNLWDVLKSLVDGLFALADSVVGLAGKIWDSLFDNLMKLLIPNDPNFLSDKLSSVGDKFSLKFEGIFKFTDIFSNLFNVSPNDEFFNMKLNFNGTEFPLDFSVLKTLVETYKLRIVLGLLISISMWWDFYRKVTGTGDIIE